MKFAIHTLCTRGDVQSYGALARELIARGHAVSLAAPAQFEEFVTAYGVEFFSLPGEFLDLLDSHEARAAASPNQHVWRRSCGGSRWRSAVACPYEVVRFQF